MKRVFNRGVIGLLVFVITFNFVAVRSNAEGKKGKTVRVGYYSNEVFEDGSSDDDIKKGYAYEYYRKISEYTGWEYEYIYGDFVSIYNKLLNGDVDLVAGLAYTESRSSQILYPANPMGAESYGIVKHEGDKSITKAHKTLDGKTIGVLNSAIVDVLKKFLDKENISVKIVAFDDYETLLKAFDKKELDVIAAEIDGIYDRSHAEVLYSFGETEYYLGVNVQRPELLQELNSAQEQLFQENPGYLSLLRNKYYSSTLSSRAFTKSESEWISAHKILRIGYLNNFLPFSSADENGNPTGIISELIPSLIKELGINGLECKYISFDSYDDIVAAIDNEDIDVGFPLGGGLYFSEKDGLYLTNSVISSVTDLVFNEKYKGSSGATFAICENNNLQKYYIQENYPNVNVKMYPTIDDCLDAVSSGEASCTTLNGLRTGAILSMNKSKKLSFMQLNESEDNCFGVKIGNDGLLKLLNRGLNIIGQDYIQNLAMNYSQSMYTYTVFDFIRYYLWQIIAIILALIVLINCIVVINARKRDKLAKEVLYSKIKIEQAHQDKLNFVDKITNSMREPMSKLTSLIDSSKRTSDLAKIENNLDDMAEQSKLLITQINNISSLVKNNEE